MEEYKTVYPQTFEIIGGCGLDCPRQLYVGGQKYIKE